MARGASSHARRPSMPVSKRAVWPWSKRRSATAVRSSVAAFPTWASDSPIVWALEPPVPTPITTRPGARSCRVAMALAVTETWREWHRHAGTQADARGRRGARGQRHPQLAADQVRVGDPRGVVAEALGELHLPYDVRQRLGGEDRDVELHADGRSAEARWSSLGKLTGSCTRAKTSRAPPVPLTVRSP